MPDWAPDEQSQIPDAPETPAPLFAYRALKGILFGSPDYDEEEENKENVAPIASIPLRLNPTSIREDKERAGTSNEQSTDTRPLSSRIRDLAPPATSPRKRLLSSPAKSILRTPGLPTPRRQKVNVTFKDVRASTSPVVKVTAATKSRSKASSPLKNTEPTTNTRVKQTSEADKELEAVPTSVYDMASVESYLQSTEREMKRLVRYSQKMREYARRSDQENVALKRERDKLKQEVELLKRFSGQKISSKKPVNRTKGSGQAGGEAWAQQPKKKAVRQIKSAIDKDGSSGQEAARKAEFASIGRRAIEEPGVESGIDWIDLAKPVGELFGPEEHRVGDGVGDGERQEPDVAKPVASRRTSAPTKAQLAPDRLAAAKERLRVKSEQRRRVLSS